MFACFVWISEQTAIISLHSIDWLVFTTETECVYCAVRTGSLNQTDTVSYLKGKFIPQSCLCCQILTQDTSNYKVSLVRLFSWFSLPHLYSRYQNWVAGQPILPVRPNHQQRLVLKILQASTANFPHGRMQRVLYTPWKCHPLKLLKAVGLEYSLVELQLWTHTFYAIKVPCSGTR